MDGILPNNPSCAHNRRNRNNPVPPNTVYHKYFTERLMVEFLEVRFTEVDDLFVATEFELSYKDTKVRKDNSCTENSLVKLFKD
jgi:hypothetical protein